jgi:hypothetical protein
VVCVSQWRASAGTRKVQRQTQATSCSHRWLTCSSQLRVSRKAHPGHHQAALNSSFFGWNSQNGSISTEIRKIFFSQLLLVKNMIWQRN